MTIAMKKIGQVLVDRGLITESQLAEALKLQPVKQKYIGEIFVEQGWVTQDQMTEALAHQYKIPFVRLGETAIDRTIMEKVPLKIAMHYNIMPVRLNDRNLTVAISNPQDIRVLDELRLAFHQRYNIDSVLATAEDIKKTIERYYGLAADTVDEILTKKSADRSQDTAMHEKVVDIGAEDQEASVVKLVNQILLEAHQSHASDIHIEPFRGKPRLRYRVDGLLRTIETPGKMSQLFPAIISRIKILSKLDIVERRIPQDGRASVKVGETRLDLRTSVMPTPAGESVVIRILPSQMLFDLKGLGFRDDAMKKLEQILQKKYGIVFVTGPTGSGKSTTLYAFLRKINNENMKIITIEDPVEYEMEGMTQIQINPKVGLTFAQGLRSMLRHDPDCMMVGEVRDLETAELAIRIALTGHVVFSTLHTNDAATGVTRLIDMGIDPFLVTSSVQCFIAQRLVRLNCQKCLREVPSKWPEAKKVFQGQGCKECQNSGFQGRTVIYEILVLTSEIRDMIMKRASAEEIKKKAVQNGMRTLTQEGWEKVNLGLTTPEEIFRAVSDDWEVS